MTNELKILVREAFNTAYSNHKFQKLSEITAKEKGDLLAATNPQLKIKADEILAKIIKNPNIALQYKWNPQSSDDVKKQLNYIIDTLVELYKSTKDEVYKKALSYIYSPFAEAGKHTPVYSYLLQRLRWSTALERLMEKSPEVFEELLTKAWSKVFYGQVRLGKRTAGEREKGTFAPMFDEIAKLYSGSKTIDAGFGSQLLENLYKDLLNLIRKEERKDPTISIDAPLSSTGKPRDVEDGDDFGSDVPEADEEDLASQLGSTDAPRQSSQYKHPELKIAKLKSAIKEIVDIARSEGVGSEAALITLWETAVNSLNYAEISDKYKSKISEFEKRKPGDLLRDLVFKNKKFQELSNYILNKYNLPSLMDINFQWLTKGEKFIPEPTSIETGDEDEKDGDEEYLWEKFLNENMGKIIENVYNKLSKKL